MFNESVLYAILAGIAIAAIAAPLGCFVVWRRMAYFGDSLAHSALLGIAIGLIYGVSIHISIMVVALAFALILVWLQQKHILETDTLLGILAHAALAFGLIAMALSGQEEIEVHDYLLGDILNSKGIDLIWIYSGGLLMTLCLIIYWSDLVLMTIHEELAKAEGVKTFWMNLLMMSLMTILVAVSVHLVGVLLIASLLIIPAASARQFVRSPEAMAVVATILALFACTSGVLVSAWLGTASGPTIVSILAAVFVILLPLSMINWPTRKNRWQRKLRS